jgi:hypothetical protein
LQQLSIPDLDSGWTIFCPAFHGEFQPLGTTMPFLLRPWHLLLICLAGWIKETLANLGHTLSPCTIQNILQEQGIEPAPRRRKNTTWKAFLIRHWDVLAAMDFTILEV